jgi:hypothetical protein
MSVSRQTAASGTGADSKRKLNFYNSGDENVTVMGAIYD